MDPSDSEYYLEQNMFALDHDDSAYNQICQGQTSGAPMLEVSENGATHGTQQACHQFVQGQVSYTSEGAIYGEPEIRGTYGIQGQNLWTTWESMFKLSETGSTDRTQPVHFHQFGQGQAPCTPVPTILEDANIEGFNETRQEVPMGTMNGEPVIGGTGIKGESLSGRHQTSMPLRKTQKALDFRGTELPEGDEEEEASQTYHNQHSPYAGEQTGACCHRPHRTVRKKKVIPGTRVLNENILPCKSESGANNSKGKAVSGSSTPEKTKKKRATDRKYRERKSAQNQQIRDDLDCVSKEKEKLEEKLTSALKELLLLKNHGQPNVSSKRKAVFEFNDANNAEAMKIVGGLPGMVNKITLNVKKRRLKLKGDFDVKALLPKLKMCCDARLISNEDVSAMPGPSTSARLRVPAVQLR